MYAAIWRLLPGPWPVKLLLAMILILAVVAVLFLYVFPVIAPYMPFAETEASVG